VYDIETCIAEMYDQTETQTEDVALIRRLIGGRGPLRILEPFCGTGRILIPLTHDGHEIVGMDRARNMLGRAREKIARLGPEVQARITLVEADVTQVPWPTGFDLVILGGNCMYELPTPEVQEGCIAAAAAALRPGGLIYVDNDHMEGELDPAWRRPGVQPSFPQGECADGTTLEGSMETVWYDAQRRLVRFRRRVRVTRPDGCVIEREYLQQKHPVSAGEVRGWLEGHGVIVEREMGDRAGHPYTEDAPRAIFWARKGE
jgi:SAM-dependent methyltransferase